MKKSLFTIMAVGLMTTAANAAFIGFRWAETPDQKLAASSGTVEVWLNLVPGDVVSSVLTLFGDMDQPNLNYSDPQAVIPGWNAGGQTGNWGQPQTTSFGVVAPAPGLNLTTPGMTLAGTFKVTVLPPYDGSEKPIFAGFHAAPAGVVDGTGNVMTWDARYADGVHNGYTGYSGFMAYMDWGNPGWGAGGMPAAKFQPTPNPLIITKTPEPTSLALVALGGFALLRRRR